MYSSLGIILLLAFFSFIIIMYVNMWSMMHILPAFFLASTSMYNWNSFVLSWCRSKHRPSFLLRTLMPPQQALTQQWVSVQAVRVQLCPKASNAFHFYLFSTPYGYRRQMKYNIYFDIYYIVNVQTAAKINK